MTTLFDTFPYITCWSNLNRAVYDFLECERRVLGENIGPKDSVLELGAGDLRLTPFLVERSRILVSVDNSPTQLYFGKARLSPAATGQLFVMDARQLAFPDNSFTVVVGAWNLLGVIGFPVNRMKVLCEAHRVLKPGGKLIFTVYSESAPSYQVDCYKRWGLSERLPSAEDHTVSVADPSLKRTFHSTYFSQSRLEALIDVSLPHCEIREVEPLSGIGWCASVVKGGLLITKES